MEPRHQNGRTHNGELYSIGAGGLTPIGSGMDVQLEPGTYLPVGASSDPDWKIVVSADDQVVRYVSPGSSVIEQSSGSERPIFVSLARKGAETEIKRLRHYFDVAKAEGRVPEWVPTRLAELESWLAGGPGPQKDWRDAMRVRSWAVATEPAKTYPRGDAWYQAEGYGNVGSLDVGVTVYEIDHDQGRLDQLMGDPSMRVVYAVGHEGVLAEDAGWAERLRESLGAAAGRMEMNPSQGGGARPWGGAQGVAPLAFQGVYDVLRSGPLQQGALGGTSLYLVAEPGSTAGPYGVVTVFQELDEYDDLDAATAAFEAVLLAESNAEMWEILDAHPGMESVWEFVDPDDVYEDENPQGNPPGGGTYDVYEADGRNEWLRESGYFGDCQEIAYAAGSTESEEDCERAEFDAASAEEWLQESGYYEDENPQGNPRRKAREFRPGEIVRMTTAFLRSTGQTASSRINGEVVATAPGLFRAVPGFPSPGPFADWPVVLWNDADFPTLINPANVELDPRVKDQERRAERGPINLELGIEWTERKLLEEAEAQAETKAYRESPEYVSLRERAGLPPKKRNSARSDAEVAKRLALYKMEVVGDDQAQAAEIAARMTEGIDEAADICKMSPPVCVGNKGIPRSEMPQILDDDYDRLAEKGEGWKIDAAIAAGADPDLEGSVFDAFLDHLRDSGVRVEAVDEEGRPLRVPVGQLKATQREIQAAKTFGIADAYLQGFIDPSKSPIVISEDNYILDGHHRFSAVLTIDPGRKMNVVRVYAPMDAILAEAFEFPGVFRADFMGRPVAGGTPARFKGIVPASQLAGYARWAGERQAEPAVILRNPAEFQPGQRIMLAGEDSELRQDFQNACGEVLTVHPATRSLWIRVPGLTEGSYVSVDQATPLVDALSRSRNPALKLAAGDRVRPSGKGRTGGWEGTEVGTVTRVEGGEAFVHWDIMEGDDESPIPLKPSDLRRANPDTAVTPQVGDILVSSWGYDQTNIDFYEVAKVTPKQVVIEPIQQEIVEASPRYGRPAGVDRVMPLPGRRRSRHHSLGEPGEQLRRKWTPHRDSGHWDPRIMQFTPPTQSWGVSISDYERAVLWDGRPQSQTAAGMGHNPSQVPQLLEDPAAVAELLGPVRLGDVGEENLYLTDRCGRAYYGKHQDRVEPWKDAIDANRGGCYGAGALEENPQGEERLEARRRTADRGAPWQASAPRKGAREATWHLDLGNSLRAYISQEVGGLAPRMGYRWQARDDEARGSALRPHMIRGWTVLGEGTAPSLGEAKTQALVALLGLEENPQLATDIRVRKEDGRWGVSRRSDDGKGWHGFLVAGVSFKTRKEAVREARRVAKAAEAAGHNVHLVVWKADGSGVTVDERTGAGEEWRSEKAAR